MSCSLIIAVLSTFVLVIKAPGSRNFERQCPCEIKLFLD